MLLVIWKTILERRCIVLKWHLCATQDSGISCVKWTWCTVCYMRCAHMMCVVWWYDVDFDSRVCKSWREMVITPPTHPLHTHTHTSAAYMRRWTVSALVQVLTCRLFGAKSILEPMLNYCQFNPQEHASVKCETKYKTFHSWIYIWKCRLRNGGHFVQGEISYIIWML